MNTNLLRKTIKDTGKTITFLADRLGISRECFYGKISGNTEFKASEIVTLANELDLSKNTRDKIFFD